MKERAPRNRTLTCTPHELAILSQQLKRLDTHTDVVSITNQIINQDLFEVGQYLPRKFVDLLVLDPPYNLTKNYNGNIFHSKDAVEYAKWFEKVIRITQPVLKSNASIYVCSDWQTSNLIFPVLDNYFTIRSRITWEREKGRGAKSNWKNNSEDIWFCTVADDYYFDVEAVKLKKKVIAPYRQEDGSPKDWQESQEGNYRLTHPSNLWTDITIPFWSMPENTDHPTQKPEKLIAKLILASSKPNDFVFDPFLGSGTTSVVAKKLNRKFCGIEINQEYSCWAMKRLQLSDKDYSIQGYADGVFWERNTLNEQSNQQKVETSHEYARGLFDE
jgi:site-specific DNA-methyltransferase (adenine-specific)